MITMRIMNPATARIFAKSPGFWLCGASVIMPQGIPYPRWFDKPPASRYNTKREKLPFQAAEKRLLRCDDRRLFPLALRGRLHRLRSVLHRRLGTGLA